MAIFKLPDLNSRFSIVDNLGRPTDWFLRFFNLDFKGKIEEQERRQDETDAALQEQIDRINRILAGEENFTAILVENQQVQEFLSKTDGSALVDPSGLANAVVETPAVKQTDITDGVSAYSVGTVALNGTTPVEVISVTIPATGKIISLQFAGQCTIRAPLADVFHATAVIYRNGSAFAPFGYVGCYSFERAGEQFFAGELPPILIEDTPAAGSVTYSVEVELDITTATTQTALSMTLQAREHKTE